MTTANISDIGTVYVTPAHLARMEVDARRLSASPHRPHQSVLVGRHASRLLVLAVGDRPWPPDQRACRVEVGPHGREQPFFVPLLDSAGGAPNAGGLTRVPIDGEPCWFSSAGPTLTGIAKPDIMAPGAAIVGATLTIVAAKLWQEAAPSLSVTQTAAV